MPEAEALSIEGIRAWGGKDGDETVGEEERYGHHDINHNNKIGCSVHTTTCLLTTAN
jgi:hypothetical protein